MISAGQAESCRLNQKTAFSWIRPLLLENLDPADVLPYFLAQGTLTEQDAEEIRQKTTCSNRFDEFANRILKRDEWWDCMIRALEKNSQNFLARKLEEAFVQCSTQMTSSLSSAADGVQAQKELKEAYKLECQVMKEQWATFLDFPDEFGMEMLYTPLCLINPNTLDKGAPIEESKIFEGLSSRGNVIIVGQGGSGKTMFVNKHVLDWANDSNTFAWTGIFDYIILVTLGKIGIIPDDFDIEKLILLSFQAINLQEYFGQQILKTIHFPENQRKTLIILDGLDEVRCDQNKDFITALFKSRGLSSATVLATTRPGYFERESFSTRRTMPGSTIFGEDRLIEISGFTVKQRKEYFQKWQEKKGAERIKEPHGYLEKLLETPLFSALYCSLNIQDEQVELFDLVSLAVENIMSRYNCKNPEFNHSARKEVEEFLDYIAWAKFCVKSAAGGMPELILQHIEQNFELIELAQGIGVLWPNPHYRKKAEVSIDVVDVSFPHQIFLEFFAARYVLSHGGTYDTGMVLRSPKEDYFKYFMTGLQPSCAVECFTSGIQSQFHYLGHFINFDIHWMVIPKEELRLPNRPKDKVHEIFICKNKCNWDPQRGDNIWKQTIPKMKNEGWFSSEIKDITLESINTSGVLDFTQLLRATSQLHTLKFHFCTVPKIDCQYLASYFKTTSTLKELKFNLCQFEDEARVLKAVPVNPSLYRFVYGGQIVKGVVEGFLQFELPINIKEFTLTSVKEEQLSADVWKMLEKFPYIKELDLQFSRSTETEEFWAGTENTIRNLEQLGKIQVLIVENKDPNLKSLVVKSIENIGSLYSHHKIRPLGLVTRFSWWDRKCKLKKDA